MFYKRWMINIQRRPGILCSYRRARQSRQSTTFDTKTSREESLWCATRAKTRENYSANRSTQARSHSSDKCILKYRLSTRINIIYIPFLNTGDIMWLTSLINCTVTSIKLPSVRLAIPSRWRIISYSVYQTFGAARSARIPIVLWVPTIIVRLLFEF